MIRLKKYRIHLGAVLFFLPPELPGNVLRLRPGEKGGAKAQLFRDADLAVHGLGIIIEKEADGAAIRIGAVPGA